jgi:hypothetical protein
MSTTIPTINDMNLTFSRGIKRDIHFLNLCTKHLCKNKEDESVYVPIGSMLTSDTPDEKAREYALKFIEQIEEALDAMKMLMKITEKVNE